MFRYLGRFAVLAVCLFALAMVGCGTDDPPVEEEPIKFVSASPVEGSTIQNDATITVTFDGVPEGLKVTGGSAVPGGKTVSIAGPFAAGPLVLGLQWEGDGVVLSYTVEEPPAAIIDVSPPEGSTIRASEEIWVTFDSPPGEVEVTGPGWSSVESDNSVYIAGPFDPGPLTLTIEWDGGVHTLIYIVPRPAAIVSVNPPDGSEVAANGTITVTFDNAPTDVWVTAGGGTVSVTGKRATITGPFRPGLLELTIFWGDEVLDVLHYIVIDPDNTPPRVTGGTVKDGWIDYDPEVLNAEGVIVIEFSEEVTAGNIALQTEAGDDVGWVGKVEGTTGTLELVRGWELGWETTYVIVGTVSDASGNVLRDFRITFSTKEF